MAHRCCGSSISGSPLRFADLDEQHRWAIVAVAAGGGRRSARWPRKAKGPAPGAEGRDTEGGKPKAGNRRGTDRYGGPRGWLFGVSDHDRGILRWPASRGFHNHRTPGQAQIPPAAPATPKHRHRNTSHREHQPPAPAPASALAPRRLTHRSGEDAGNSPVLGEELLKLADERGL